MTGSPRIPEATARHPVWLALQNYTIGPPDAEFSFAQRLARENHWRADHAQRVIDEYRRFCFLAVTAGHEVTPSDAVDQVWHLHLTYSRDYWDRFCPEVLGARLHHGPTTGGTAQRAHFFELYARTLKSYEAAFGQVPPEDLWPSGARRLMIDPLARRVRRDEGWVVPRRLGLMLGGLAVAAALLGGLWLAGGRM